MRLNALSQTVALLILSAGTVQAESMLTTLGRHPFHQPPLRSADDLKTMMREHQEDVKAGLDKAGSSAIQALLDKQFPLAEIKEAKYGPGTKFRWMLFKQNGKGQVKVARDLTWGGAAAVDGYEFTLEEQEKCLLHTFAVPKICGNLALLKTDRLENCPAAACADCPKECPAECRLNPANREKCPAECKNCKTECLPEFTCHDFPLDCPAECLVFPDDQEKCPAECKGIPDECVVDCSDDCPPVTCADCPPECALHPDYCPDDCKLLDCPPSESKKEQLPLRFVADAGFFKQTDPADYLFGRVGAEWSPFAADSPFASLSLLSMMGVVPRIKGDDGDDALLLDIVTNWNWKVDDIDGWAGLGLGGWFTSGGENDSADSDMDVIANAGARIYGEPQSFNVSVLLEIRSAADEFDSLAEYGRFGAGVRCRF